MVAVAGISARLGRSKLSYFFVVWRAFVNAGRVVRYVVRHPANKGHRLSVVGRAAVFQLRGRVLRKPTITTLGEHSRMIAELHSSGSSRIIYSNPPDWNEMHAWRILLRPGDIFIDVGANVGLYTLWAADRGAAVIAFEPSPPAADRLRRNLHLNSYDVELHEVALGAEAGWASFGGATGTTGHLDELGRETVRVRTLDEVLGNRHARGIKVDVEGFERLVLQGAKRALSEGRIDYMQLEWNHTSRTNMGEDRTATEAILRSHGYNLGRPDSNGELVAEAADEGADIFAWRT